MSCLDFVLPYSADDAHSLSHTTSQKRPNVYSTIFSLLGQKRVVSTLFFFKWNAFSYYPISNVKLRIGHSVLKPWALKASFFILWPLSCLGHWRQGFLSLATHWNHLGSFGNHGCLGPTSQRFQYNWSGVPAGDGDFFKGSRWLEGAANVVSQRWTPGPLCVILLAHAQIHFLPFCLEALPSRSSSPCPWGND